MSVEPSPESRELTVGSNRDVSTPRTTCEFFMTASYEHVVSKTVHIIKIEH